MDAFRSARLFSDRNSVRRGDISYLAIFETMLAMGFSLWLAVHIGSYKILALSVLIAPFVLLKTNASTRYGLQILDKLRYWKSHSGYYNKFTHLTISILSLFLYLWVFAVIALFTSFNFPELFEVDVTRLIHAVLFLPLIVVFTLISFLFLSPIIRIGATVYGFVEHPIYSISAIPGNWRRVVLSTDIFTSPEIIPGYTTHTRGKGSLIIRNVWESSDIYAKRKKIPKPIKPLLYPFVYFFCFVYSTLIYIPALLFRFSIKSTAIVWTPIIYFTSQAFNKHRSLTNWVDLITQDSLWRVRQIYSALIVFIGIFKLSVYNDYFNAHRLWVSSGISKYIDILFIPSELPPWQIVAVFNAVFILFVRIYSARISFYYKQHIVFDEIIAKNTITFTIFFVSAFGLYPILMGIGILLKNVNLPPLGSWLAF